MLEELSTIMADDCEDDNESNDKDDMDLDEKNKLHYRTGDMDVDGRYHQNRLLHNSKVVKNIGIVVRDLRNLGFTSMAEDAYASAIFLLLKVCVFSSYLVPLLHSFLCCGDVMETVECAGLVNFESLVNMKGRGLY